MTICLSGPSALEYWAYHRYRTAGPIAKDGTPLPRPEAVDLRTFDLGSPDGDEVAFYSRCYEGILSGPLHLLVCTKGDRRRPRKAKCHINPGPLPPGSILRIDESLHAASPELALLQCAATVSRIELIRLMCGACGRYAVRLPGAGCPEAGPNESRVMDARPLTSVGKLEEMIDAVSPTDTSGTRAPRGIKNARFAVRHAVGNAASPREIVLYLMLCLPIPMGGYGLPKPALNPRIETAEADRKRGAGSFYRADLYWENARLDVEYDSIQEHAHAEKIAKDALRRNALESMGITVRTATNDHLRHLALLDHLAKQIALEIGFKLRTNRDPKWRQHQVELRDALLRPREQPLL